jgi:hypothetical protein
MMFDVQMTKKKTTTTITTKATTAILQSATVVLSVAVIFLALLSPLLSQQEAEAAYGLLSPSDRDRVADRLEALADDVDAKGFDELAAKLRAEAAEARAGGGYG